MNSQPAQFIGQSSAFHALMDKVSNAAALDRPVLVKGERGSGKNMTASRLHFLSPRWEAHYLTTNCTILPEAELDISLFGGETETGLLSQAEGGTLFLDKIDALTPRLQEKLLDWIERDSKHAGTDDDAPKAARIITASHKDLLAMTKNGEFTAPLLEHLTFDVVTVPTLRARREDIAPLIMHFGRKISASLGANVFPGLTPEAMEYMEGQNWPGNIRQLKIVTERSVAQSYLEDDTLSTPIDLILISTLEPDQTQTTAPREQEQPISAKASPQTSAGPRKSFTERTLAFERRLIDEALRASEDHQGKAAQYLELTYHSFRGLLRKHGLKK